MTLHKKILFATVYCVFLLCSCTSLKEEPGIVLTNFFDAMHKKKFAEAKALATRDSKQFIDAIETMSTSVKLSSIMDADYFNKAKMEFGDATVINGIVKIPVKVKIKDGIIKPTYTLKKEDNEWKVALDFVSQIDLGSTVEQY